MDNKNRSEAVDNDFQNHQDEVNPDLNNNVRQNVAEVTTSLVQDYKAKAPLTTKLGLWISYLIQSAALLNAAMIAAIYHVFVSFTFKQVENTISEDDFKPLWYTIIKNSLLGLVALPFVWKVFEASNVAYNSWLNATTRFLPQQSLPKKALFLLFYLANAVPTAVMPILLFLLVEKMATAVYDTPSFEVPKLAKEFVYPVLVLTAIASASSFAKRMADGHTQSAKYSFQKSLLQLIKQFPLLMTRASYQVFLRTLGVVPFHLIVSLLVAMQLNKDPEGQISKASFIASGVWTGVMFLANFVYNFFPGIKGFKPLNDQLLLREETDFSHQYYNIWQILKNMSFATPIGVGTFTAGLALLLVPSFSLNLLITAGVPSLFFLASLVASWKLAKKDNQRESYILANSNKMGVLKTQLDIYKYHSIDQENFFEKGHVLLQNSLDPIHEQKSFLNKSAAFINASTLILGLVFLLSMLGFSATGNLPFVLMLMSLLPVFTQLLEASYEENSYSSKQQAACEAVKLIEEIHTRGAHDQSSQGMDINNGDQYDDAHINERQPLLSSNTNTSRTGTKNSIIKGLSKLSNIFSGGFSAYNPFEAISLSRALRNGENEQKAFEASIIQTANNEAATTLFPG